MPEVIYGIYWAVFLVFTHPNCCLVYEKIFWIIWCVLFLKNPFTFARIHSWGFMGGKNQCTPWGTWWNHDNTYSIDPLSTLRLSGKLIKFFFHLSTVLLPCAVLLYRGALVLNEKWCWQHTTLKSTGHTENTSCYVQIVTKRAGVCIYVLYLVVYLDYILSASIENNIQYGMKMSWACTYSSV